MAERWADIADVELEVKSVASGDEAEAPRRNVRYLNEDLPEIEVREKVSVEEMRREMPNFIAFTDRQIEGKIRSLFTMEGAVLERKTEILVKLHKHVIAAAAAGPQEPSGVYYYTPDIDRADNSDIFEIMQQYEAIDKSRSHVAKQVALREAALGLVSKAADDASGPLPTKTTELIIDFNPIDIATVLAGDLIHLPIQDRVTLDVPTLEEAFLAERVEARNRFEEMAPPVFERIISSLKELPDTHFLDILMAKHNVDSVKAKMLGSILRRLEEKEAGEGMPAASGRHGGPRKLKIVGLDESGQALLMSVLKNITPIISEISVQDVTALAQSQAANASFGSITGGLPKTNYAIAKELAEGRLTPEDLGGAILRLRNMENTQRDIAFVRAMATFNAERFNAKLAKKLADWSLVHMTLRDDIGQILDIYKEVNEIKVGNDTSRYDGDIPGGEQFDNKESGEVFRPMPGTQNGGVRVLDEGTRVVFDIKKLFPDEVPPGKEEVVLPVAAMLEQLRSVSGLPFIPNMATLLQRASESVNRLSRRTILTTAFPDVADEIVQEILDSEVAYDNFLLPPGFQELAQKVRREYQEDVQEVTLRAVAGWLIELQLSAMGGGLDLDLSSAATSCLIFWSPYGGAPLNDSKTGILPYLTHVIQLIVKNEYIGIWPAFFPATDAAALQRSLSTILDGPGFLGGRERLEESWVVFKRDRKDALVDKAKMAEMSLIDAINNKDKARFLPNYIKALILLPRVLAAREKDQAAFTVPGCCLQRLYSGFKANEDLQKYVFTQRMERLREVFAKKRVGMQLRPQLASHPVEKKRKEAEEGEIKKKEKAEVERLEPLGVPLAADLDQIEWLRNLNIPPLHIKRVREDVKEATVLAEEMWATFQKTIRSKSAEVTTFIFGETTSTEDLAAIIAMMPSVLSEITKKPEDMEMINSGIQRAIEIRKATQLTGVISKVGERYFHRVFQYLLTTALLLPTPIAGTTVKGFYEKALSATLKKVEIKIRAMRVPTEADIQDTLNKLRESDKVKAIQMQDVMQDDDRSAFNMLKNLLAKTAETREYMEGRERLGVEEAEAPPDPEVRPRGRVEEGEVEIDPFKEGDEDWGTDEGFGYGVEKGGEDPDWLPGMEDSLD